MTESESQYAKAPVMEKWMNVTEGMVSYVETDRHGRTQGKIIGPGKVFRIPERERINAEELYPGGAFTNGVLKCLDGELNTPDQPGKTDDELLAMVDQVGGQLGACLAEASKLTVSRLRRMCERPQFSERLTVWHAQVINGVWDERWPARPIPSMHIEGAKDKVH